MAHRALAANNRPEQNTLFVYGSSVYYNEYGVATRVTSYQNQKYVTKNESVFKYYLILNHYHFFLQNAGWKI